MFDNAIISTHEIYRMFNQNIPEASLEPWVLTTASTTQGSIFEASNRFFTSKHDAPDMEPIPILPLIDPHSILNNLQKGEFLHGEEKQVYYYSVYKNASRSSKRYEMHILEHKS